MCDKCLTLSSLPVYVPFTVPIRSPKPPFQLHFISKIYNITHFLIRSICVKLLLQLPFALSVGELLSVRLVLFGHVRWSSHVCRKCKKVASVLSSRFNPAKQTSLLLLWLRVKEPQLKWSHFRKWRHTSLLWTVFSPLPHFTRCSNAYNWEVDV